jgi:hypothetical protein
VCLESSQLLLLLEVVCVLAQHAVCLKVCKDLVCFHDAVCCCMTCRGIKMA